MAVVREICLTPEHFVAPLFLFLIVPVKAIRQGIGAGTAEHSVKALQIALSEDLLGGLPSPAGKIEGYGVSFNFSRPRVMNMRPGMYLGPDRLHESNHGEV